MKCLILGTGTGLPHPDYHLSSTIVQTREGTFLVDCGEGTSKQLLRNGVGRDDIDAVLISHYHPDHVSGLYMLLQMLYLQGRTKPLNLFLPERPAAWLDTLHMFYTFEQKFQFELKVHEASDLELYFNNVSAILTDHLLNYSAIIGKHQYQNQMQSYCFTFGEENKSLVITSDISSFENLRETLETGDLVILDGLHPAGELIIDLLNAMSGHLVLTHGSSTAIQHWMEEHPDSGIEIAKENTVYEI